MTLPFRHVALIGKYQASGARGAARDSVMEGIGSFLESQGCKVYVELPPADDEAGQAPVAASRYDARTVEEIGRWSMVDPFVIGAFVPVMNYNSLIYGRAEAASVPFTAVVVLTIISAKTFDPRLMWDAAQTARRAA